MLEGHRLTSVRAGRTLFADLSLGLPSGGVLQVEGANGAGKTTLLRILCGLTLPRAGTVCWQGTDIRACRPVYHQTLLYIGHNPGLKPELTALENLRFFHALQGQRGEAAALERALQRVGLYGYEESPVRTLSAGQRRRVALARLWLSAAPLWVLDEPFTAIDRAGVRALEIRLREHAAAGGMVAITSHQMLHLDGYPVQQLALG